MLSALPVLILATVFGAAPLIVTLQGRRLVVMLLLLREKNRRYRAHREEGWLSETYEISISKEGDPLGAFMFSLSGFFPDLKPYEEKILVLTDSELEDLRLLLRAVEKHPAYEHLMQVLSAVMEHGLDPADVEQEINNTLELLYEAIPPITRFLQNHDESRIKEAA